MSATHQVTSDRSPWQPCEAPDWRQLQVKRLFAVELGKMLQNEPTSATDREVPYLKALHVHWDGVRISDDVPTMWASQWEIDALRVELGDLLVCEGGEVGRGAIVEIEPPEDCIIQNALHRVRGKAEGDVRFLRYLLIHAASQGWFEVLCNRATIAHFTVDKFREMWLWVPSLDQQKAIADFLDGETLRIDTLLKEKESLLTLLAEKRVAIISHAVTRGLISKTPQQDSSLPWLGEIPEHWRIERAKYLFKQSSIPVSEEDEIVTCFRDGQVTLRKNRREEGFTNAILELGYQGIREGQLVLHSMDAFAGAIGVSDSDGKCSPEYIICDPGSEDIINDYYGYLLRIMALSGFIQASCPAVRERAPRIRFNDFGEMFFPVPPLGEQRAIVEHIKTETKKLDDLRVETEHTIDLLKERRAALIAAAVTGQLNVGVQA